MISAVANLFATIHINNHITYVTEDGNTPCLPIGPILWDQPRHVQLPARFTDLRVFLGGLEIKQSTNDQTDLETGLVSKARARLINFLNGQISQIHSASKYQRNFRTPVDQLRKLESDMLSDSPDHRTCGRLLGLIEDLTGQITMALRPEYIRTWGIHFLLSNRRAHELEQYNSFKDPGKYPPSIA